MNDDDEEHKYTFNFMISGEITIIAANEIEAYKIIENELQNPTIAQQPISATIETYNLDAIDDEFL